MVPTSTWQIHLGHGVSPPLSSVSSLVSSCQSSCSSPKLPVGYWQRIVVKRPSPSWPSTTEMATRTHRLSNCNYNRSPRTLRRPTTITPGGTSVSWRTLGQPGTDWLWLLQWLSSVNGQATMVSRWSVNRLYKTLLISLPQSSHTSCHP
jgi:hypothetical protein